MPSPHESVIKDADFRNLADLLPDFIGRYDTEGRILYFNQQLRKALGISLDQVINRKSTEAWPDGRFIIYEDKVLQCAQTGTPSSLDLTVPEFNGRIEYHHIRFVAEKDTAGKIIGVIAFGRDMTDRILFEQKLTSNSRLAGLGEMAQGIAHEINNPLAILIGKCRQIEKRSKDKTFTKENTLCMVFEIELVAKRISQIIKRLRLFARDADKDPLLSEDIHNIINDSAAICNDRFESAGIQLSVNTNEVGPMPLDCRATQISQAIVNLLNNSYDNRQWKWNSRKYPI
jgi:PAS domain S-box-containing protein